MEPEQYILKVIAEKFPQMETFVYDQSEFNNWIQAEDRQFPVIFIDKTLQPQGNVSQNGLMRETLQFNLIVFDNPDEFEVAEQKQMDMIAHCRLKARSIYAAIDRYGFPENTIQLQRTYSLTPFYWSTDSHLIGVQISFTLEYVPDVDYC